MKNKIICERAREIQKQAFAFSSERNKCRVKTPAPPRPGLILFILSLFLISIFLILPAMAGAVTSPLLGFAWSDTIGWISFNCSDTGICGISYRVIRGDDGMFSGYAWSENIGWITFNQSQLNGEGWARACAGTVKAGDPYLTDPVNNPLPTLIGDCSTNIERPDGWDGWINSQGTWANGVWLDANYDPAEFKGYAWGDDVVGWISFNCKDREVATGKTCKKATDPDFNPAIHLVDYKVVTFLPFITTPTVSNPAHSFAGACGQSRIPTFSWDTDAQKPYDYEIQIDEDPNFGSVNVNDTALSTDSTFWSPVCSKCCDVSPYNSILFGVNTYYWQVRARNIEGDWSAWAGGSFDTKEHCYPSPDFLCNGADCSTIRPIGEEIVTLTDNSTPHGEATIDNCSWSLPFGSTVVETYPPSFCQLDVKFSTGSNQDITLTATDSSGYFCPITQPINVILPLPEWREIPPFIWVNKLLAMVTDLFKNL